MWGHVASNLWQGCTDYEKDDYGHETLSWILVQGTYCLLKFSSLISWAPAEQAGTTVYGPQLRPCSFKMENINTR